MPITRRNRGAAGAVGTPPPPAPAPSSGIRRRQPGERAVVESPTVVSTAGAPSDEPTAEDLALGAGGAGLLLGGALAARNPAAASGLLRKGMHGVAVARMASMLSGLAPLKSMMGNLIAPVNAAMERGSYKPVREFVSKQTLSDWWKALKAGGGSETREATGLMQGSHRWNLPGRVMGAGDFATQQALIRGGLTPKEAAREVLQAPLGESWGKVGEVLEGPVAETLIPFRRTPFNQFSEGMRAMTPDYPHKAITAGYAGAGAVGGAMSAEEQYPILPGMQAAASGRYAVPSAMGAFVGRKIAGGKGGGGIVSSTLPVSEYGIEESLTNPLKPLHPSHWGIVRAVNRLLGEQ